MYRLNEQDSGQIGNRSILFVCSNVRSAIYIAHNAYRSEQPLQASSEKLFNIYERQKWKKS